MRVLIMVLMVALVGLSGCEINVSSTGRSSDDVIITRDDFNFLVVELNRLLELSRSGDRYVEQEIVRLSKEYRNSINFIIENKQKELLIAIQEYMEINKAEMVIDNDFRFRDNENKIILSHLKFRMIDDIGEKLKSLYNLKFDEGFYSRENAIEFYRIVGEDFWDE